MRSRVRRAAMHALRAAYDDVGGTDVSCIPLIDKLHAQVLLTPPGWSPDDDASSAAAAEGAAHAGRQVDVEPATAQHKPALAIAHRMWRAATVALWRSDHDDLLGGDAELAGVLSGDVPSDTEVGAWFTERARYVPLRLALRERKTLRLLEGMMGVTEYTSLVDTPVLAANPAKRTQKQLREIHLLLVALVTAFHDAKAGQRLNESRDYARHAGTLASMFEALRRYKVTNPEKMRTSYGKLLFLLQDANSSHGLAAFGPLLKPLETVYTHLERHGGLALLGDELLAVATQCIAADPEKNRSQIQAEIRAKEKAVEALVNKYRSATLSADKVRLALYSLGDNNAYMHQARDPIDRMIRLLCVHFPAAAPENASLSLAIGGGEGGARLSHSHSRQHAFALQSLLLWREIAHEMFKLWCLAEADLLDGSSPYSLRDTGQGLQRVQPARRTERAMRELLHHTQRKLGTWVGSAVIHMGDTNVPNALTFIDKYAAIERILNPLLLVLDAIASPRHQPAQLQSYIALRWHSPTDAVKAILCDFFKFAFDGSGADNFYDAGSCIDGRLTSAWNWCSQVASKPYYPLFKMCGFIGFDGEFQA
ncbi:hypothetical protein KFE25_013441 [Diacronema lutheri]|uniref:Non-canonical E2 ubiquitin-conjugating enzyme C-terminal domain-containing protein n=2 Tax=Diacronema lutheri TaxID=2081491 RepID=A0A8J5XNE3_DIALT|nr:hypothetical protein KFE25_013441 [Diacronema lutheri]